MKNNRANQILASLVFIAIFLIQNKTFGINYNFAASSGTYTANAGTNIWTTGDDAYTSTPIDIGFTFNFGGCTTSSFTQVKISTNGWLALGTSATGAQATNNITWTSYGPLLAPLWDDLAIGTGGNVNYKTSGTAGSRVFTVEWLNMEWTYAATSPAISFQVKLYEANGKIEYIYKQEAGSLSSPSASIGINGGTSGDYYSLNNTGTNPSAIYGTATNNLNTKPATGQVYSWTLPTVMTYVSSTVDQTSTADVYASSTNQQIISIPITISGGCTPFNLTQLIMNMSGTTSLADVTNIDVYYTGTSPLFAVTTLFGSALPASGNITINGLQALQNGINYFWIVYDISATAITGNILDAQCTQITMDNAVGNKTPTLTNPAGSRPIALTPCSYAKWIEQGWAKRVIPCSGGGMIWVGSTTNTYSSGGSDLYIVKTSTDINNINWTCVAGTATGSESAEDIIETSDGFIIVGWSNLSGNYDILVLKINLTGSIQWKKTIGSSSHDRGYGITLTTDGNVAICGEEGSGSDGYFAKIDNATGAILAEKTISYPAKTVRLNDITQTSDGGFLMCGDVSNDFYIIKLTSTYTLSWEMNWGGGNTDKLLFVLQNTAKTNDYTVGGYTYSYGAGSNDGYIMRFTETGGIPTVSWVEAIGSADGNSFSDGKITPDGGYIISGITTRLGDPLNNEAFLVKLNSSGGNTIIKSIGTSIATEDEEGYGIAVLPDGSYAMSGLHNNAFGANFYLMNISNTGFNCALVQDNGGITPLTTPTFTTSGSTVNAPFGFTTSNPTLTTGSGGAIAPDGCTTLPVELISFTGSNYGKYNQLNWSTCSEINNNFFTLESSTDGINWNVNGTIKGAGNSNTILHYTLIDNNISSLTYYRLKQTDFDGKFTYSQIIAIKNMNTLPFEITEIYPNPVVDQLNFTYYGSEKNINVLIYNDLGSLIKRIEFADIENGYNSSINFTNFPQGVYFIKFLQDRSQSTFKIIK